MLNTQTLRPGKLVRLSVRKKGNVSYFKEITQEAALRPDGSETEAWNTRRFVADKAELELAKKVASQARNVIARTCAYSTEFGLLCPQDNIAALESAVNEAREIAREFNASAKLTRVSVHYMTGQIARDDVEAMKSINAEVREIMEAMTDGVKRLDAEAIRDGADRLKQIGSMLTPEAEARTKLAIETGRKAANEIAKAVRAGEQAALQVDQLAIRRITEQRTMFLDLEEFAPMQAPDARPGRAVDMIPDEPEPAPQASAPQAPAAIQAQPRFEW